MAIGFKVRPRYNATNPVRVVFLISSAVGASVLMGACATRKVDEKMYILRLCLLKVCVKGLYSYWTGRTDVQLHKVYSSNINHNHRCLYSHEQPYHVLPLE